MRDFFAQRASGTGSRGSQQYTRKNGDSHVDDCWLARYAKSTYGNLSSHSTPLLSVVLASIEIRVRLYLSTSPSVWGCYAVVWYPRSICTSFISPDRKARPRSDNTSLGTPWRDTTSSTSSLAIVADVWSGTANTSDHLVR